MATDLDPLRRFSDRVEDYVRYRPTYPAGVIELLSANCGLSDSSVVADVGAGTGIFTRLLLGTGATVFAVEPNDAMQAAAQNALSSSPRFISVNGTAEATGLKERSVSIVTCAQAFHWFDPARTRSEFRRILQPSGWCALIWNSRVTAGSAFAVGFERIVREFGTARERVRHEDFEREGRFDEFFGAGRWTKRTFEHTTALSFEALAGRLLSASYVPKAGPAARTHDRSVA